MLKVTVWSILLVTAVWALDTRFGLAPPLGRVLSPCTGFWQNAEPLNDTNSFSIRLNGINRDVVVKYDTDAVPHLFAHSNYDLYFAQGFITARDRLWQMDLQARTASGRLAEIFGDRALDGDVHYRRLGLSFAAENALELVLADQDTKEMLMGYTAGVNAYIRQLTKATYPVEYKLFDCKPEEWRPVNTLVTLKLIAETLTGGESDFDMENALGVMGKNSISELFSRSFRYPVIPDSAKGVYTAAPGISRTDVLGSNNWAISDEKSANGFPILANDPHLKLTLPSIWYQLQLEDPGSNAYGVSIPGVPGIVVGFNGSSAWGVTNASADVTDWYRIAFKDSTRNEYRYNGEWAPTVKRVEKYKVRGGVDFYDTTFYTRQGPVVYDGRNHKKTGLLNPAGDLEGFSLRWTMHDPSNELKALYLLDRAKNYEDYRAAIAFFNCPAQNFVFADKKNIAMTSSGKFPLRNDDRWKYLRDGSLPADDWQGWIPMDKTPFMEDPSRGYVSSANQVLAGHDYGWFIPGDFALPYRAARINESLDRMTNANVDSMRLLQMDSYSEMAAEVLPDLLKYVDRNDIGIGHGKEIFTDLATWDYRFDTSSRAATVFTAWWSELNRGIWGSIMERKGVQMPWPDYCKTVSILTKDTDSRWIGFVKSPVKGALGDIVNAAFEKALYQLRRRYGQYGENWAWGKVSYCSITNLTNIPAFSVRFNGVGGAPNTIDAIAGQVGPSWRMVVALGPSVKGYGILPGGQSGNPGSYFYDNQIPSWQGGRLNELLYLDSPGDMRTQMRSTLTFKP
jgi:penicillin amidase